MMKSPAVATIISKFSDELRPRSEILIFLEVMLIPLRLKGVAVRSLYAGLASSE